MPSSYEHEGLWAKAVLFINRAFTALDEERPFEESALWAAFSLELLAKSALAKVNPVLIADPTDDGKSALIAAGLSRESGGFKSVQAKTVFSRCARAFPPFSSREANTIALNRNEYLHSAAPSFAALPEAVWWQRFWVQVALLLSAQDRTLEEFVGSERMQDIEAQLEADRENRKRRVEALIGRARQRLELRSHSDVSARLVSEFGQVPALFGDFDYREYVECPVCGDQGALLGSFGERGEICYDEETGDVWQDISVSADAFACENCGLSLDSPGFLDEAGLPDQFVVQEEPTPDWEEYGND